MSEQWSIPGWAGVGVVVLGLLALAGVVALALHARRRDAAFAALLAEVAAGEVARAALEERLQRLERPAAVAPGVAAQPVLAAHVITHLGELEADPEASLPERETVRIDAPLFADLVLRESVVQLGSLALGVRRALAPETRARIRAEMRREVRRSRRQRRSDLRQARREWEARQRAAVIL